MIPLINQAILMGYTATQVLDFLGKKIKNILPGITNAKSQGYSDEDILKFLSGKIKPASQSGVDKQVSEQDKYLSNIGFKTKEEREATKAKFISGAINLGSTTLGGYALSRALPKAAQALGGLIPGMQQPNNALKQISSPSSPSSISPPPPPIPSAPPSAEQTLNKLAPAVQEIKGPSDVLWNALSQGKTKGVDADTDALLRIAKKMQTTGEISTKEDFDRLFQLFTQKRKEGKNLPSALREATKEFDQVKLSQPSKIESINQQSEVSTNAPIIKTQSMPTETVGSLALTPQGDIGEIESVKNGIAKIKVGDIYKTRKTEDIEPLPISKPDLADLYQNLIQAIPEDARSSVINFAGYDANANELIFRPHSGAAYVYKDIPQEFADKLKNAMFKAKTNGENFYGSWSSGEGSRFAGLSQLIKDLQKSYGGKGKEYIRKYETLVDILEEPEKAKKAKMKAESEKRKAEKKKGKDEKESKKKRLS